MERFARAKKVTVTYHGHEWPVYPLKSREWTIYRVFHRVDGRRQAKTFNSLTKAKADALSILKEIYGKGESKIYLADGEKLDWKSATGLLKAAGIRSSLETVCRHDADLVKAAGSTSLLTDVVRRFAKSRRDAVKPARLTALREAYIAAHR